MHNPDLGDPTADGGADIIPPHLRIDLHQVRKLIQVQNPKQIPAACPKTGFDAFYVVSPICKSEGIELENISICNHTFNHTGSDQ